MWAQENIVLARWLTNFIIQVSFWRIFHLNNLKRKYMKKLKFPEGFLWGVATSSYQIEGGNSNSDWWDWEKQEKANNESGKACDYWNLYKKDHDLLSELGVGVFRFSIEWARVEVEENVFDEKVISHYREILQDLKSRNIRVQLTLWHWTSPIWFAKKYGFHKKQSIEIFARYAEKIIKEFDSFIDSYVTFNEPMVPLGMGYLGGAFPPGFQNPIKFISATNNIAKAHNAAYKIIHKENPKAKVGITYLYNWYESEGFGVLLNLINKITQWYRIDFLGNKIKGFQDFIGIDYYRLGKISFSLKNFKMDAKNQTYFGFTIEEDKENVMKWISYPEGFYNVLKEAGSKFKLPIYITENGMPTKEGIEDNERVEFIKSHLAFVHKAIAEGVDVRGYNFWSLMDNLEWLYGFQPKFGLVEIDFKTLQRKPRKSFWQYAKICKNNEVEVG
jgi:beta-glucosidase